jgi:hypothetical protein
VRQQSTHLQRRAPIGHCSRMTPRSAPS